ncbi:prepilin-type N-terminal cleavage/methylation domain-containing protein [Marinilactibacillus psychrotolerans]|uniref:Prepilin-type N-terminal cleavage/methylation domain-containing protein n=1 Tax=Marinilactibacillus psychrotolerans TaxID=191770 RepID=A0A5R9BZW5_9LACT|nr:prepilin-type N-terminal cleavage/methylation domain-containing protein [Marinilactibacillus psychrotolerans]
MNQRTYKSFSGFTPLECLIALVVLSALFLFIGQFVHTT